MAAARALIMLRADALDRRARSLDLVAQLAEQRADELEQTAAMYSRLLALLERADALDRRAESLEQLAQLAGQRADASEQRAARLDAMLDQLAVLSG